jgi:type I restriction enzyme S subunit
MKYNKLAQIADIQTGPFGSQLHKKDYVDNGTPIVTVEHLGQKNFTTQNLPCVSATDKERLSKYVLKKGDIVFSRVGSVDRCSYVSEKYDGWMFSGRCLRVRPLPEIDSEYLYYFFCLNETKEFVRGIATGATMPSINTKFMGEVPIRYPDIKEQQKISSILADLDDKIELNNAINKNLQEQAQSLYENLIADDQASTLVSLADLMDYAGGSQPPASEFIFEEREGYVRFVQIRDYDNDSHITYIPVSSRNKLCEEHDIMIARYGASLGRICAGINGAYNVALAKVFPKQPHYREFLRCYLSSRTFYEGINNRGGRSAQAGFNQSDINSFLLAVPSDEKLHQFESIASALFEQRLNLQHENQELSELRDTLLPKLMSGEIDTSAIDL